MDARDFVGQLVPNKLIPSFVFLSVFLSLVGSWTALELLHLRTANRGSYNWCLLAGSALSMGAGAIWPAHYVGEHAMVMADGDRIFQIHSDPSFIAVSFFLPIVLAGVSFYSFGITKAFSWVRTVLGGLLMGIAVCGTHYLNQLGIVNYLCINSNSHIAGAVLVAVSGSTAALSLSFYLTSTWANTWYKRLACALLLAASVSGMHWVAASGTRYKYETSPPLSGLSKDRIVIVVVCLSIGCCLALMLSAYFDQPLRKSSMDSAQEVGLALAVFDRTGSLMTMSDGSIPRQKITSDHHEHPLDITIDTDHELFTWMYRLSHCWSSIQDVAPTIRRKFRKTELNKAANTDHSSTFKLLFFIAAYDLAVLMGEQMEDLGTLFVEILQTGTIRTRRSWLLSKWRGQMRLGPHSPDGLAELGTNRTSFGRGQLLFLMRRVDEAGAQRLLEKGYRFAQVPQIIKNLSRTLEVEESRLAIKLEKMHSAAGEDPYYETGVHVVGFAIRPGWTHPLDVLVRKDAKNLLPNIRLGRSTLSTCQLEFLKEMEGATVGECLSSLRDRTAYLNPEQAKFATDFLAAVHHLAANIGKKWFLRATLAAEPYMAPCPQTVSNQGFEYATIIAFKGISNVHDYTSFNTKYEYVPNSLFMASQHVYKGCPDHEVFAKSLRGDLQEWMQRPGVATPTDTIEKRAHSPLQSSTPHSNLRFHQKRQVIQRVAPALISRRILRHLGRRSDEQDCDDNSSETILFSGRSPRFRRTVSELTIATLDDRSLGLQSGNRSDNHPLALDGNTDDDAVDIETYAEKLMILAKMEKCPMDPEDTDSWP